MNVRQYISLLYLLISFQVTAQFSISQQVPIQAISACSDTVTFQITVLTQTTLGSTGNELTLDFGPGAHYIIGSANVISTNNGVTMTMPSISVTESNVSNENVPVFSISDLVFADQFTLTYQLALDCSVIGMPVLQNVVLATMSGSNGNVSNTSDQYNASNGVMNILPNGPGASQSPNLIFPNGVVGQLYTRTIRVRNGGSSVDKFMFYDTTGVGLTVVPISGGTILSTTTVGTNVIRVYRFDDFTSIGNLDDLFDTNETIEVVQSVTIAACTNLTSYFGANYGCYGLESCGSATGTRRIGGASLNPAVQPNLVTTIRREPIVCLDEPRTGQIILKNTGTDAARQVSITIFKDNGATSASNDAIFGYLDTASITYTLYVSGTPTIIDPALTGNINNTANAEGCGYLKPRQVSFIIPLIPAGDSVVISADMIGCCNEPCTRNRFVRDGFAFSGSYLNGCGTSPRNITVQNVLPRHHLQQEVLLDAPTDVNDGDVFSMIIDVTRFFYSSPISPYTHSFEVTLPPGVMFSGSLSDIVILKANGMPYTITPTIGYDPMTNKITFTFTNVNPMQDKMKILFNNLMAVCAKGGGGAIMVDAYMMTNPMCSCNPHTLCVNRSIQLHCPIPCPRGGMYNRDFSMTRTNIGLLDNDNNGIPDSPQGTQSPFVRDNYAIHCDTFESEFTGIVVIGPDSPPEGFIYGYAIDSSQTAAKLIPLSGKVIITRPGGTTFTCTNIPVGSTGLYHYANFSISNLASCGYGPTFVGGDTVRTYITYAVSDANRYSGVFQYPVKTRYYLSNVDYRDTPFSSTTNLQMYYCDNYSGEFGLVGLYDASNGQRNLTHQSCDTLETIMDYFLGVGPSQYYSGGNFFTNEYRPISYYDTLRITVPAGYTYHRATVAYNYNGVQKLVSITPIDVNANPLVFVITNLFEINGGTLPIADEGHYIQFRTYMVASCLATSSNTININMRQRSIPVGKYDHLVTAANKLYSSTNVISYNKPNISISSAEPIVQAATDTVSWDITLTNTTPFPANNVWFGEVAGGSIEFIQAQQINCTTGALIGSVLTDNGMGVYETGTLNGNSQRCYRVTGRITSCMTNDLTISSGWNCGAYPETTPEAICDSELLLRATLLESGLNIQIVNQPLTAVELCDTITYEIIISNPNVGRTEDVIVGFTIPGGVDGVEIIPNSSFLRFPASTGTYPASPNLLDPIVNGINYEWVIPNSIIGGSGLDGTLDAPENQFRLRFKARTVPCDIRSGIRFFFNARGMSPCGVPVEATQQATQRINLVGSLGATGAFVVNTEVGMPKYCIQDSTTIDVNLLYIGSVATDGNELVSLTIPAHYQIVSGSYVATGAPAPTSGPTPAGMVVDGNVYQLSLPAGITIGDEINFSLQISKVDTAVCILDPVILTETSRVFQATCSSDLGIMCDIVEVSGDDRDTMTILPAVLSFNGPLDTTIVCSLLSSYLSSDGGYTINDACGNVTITSEIITSPPCLIDGDYSVRWISIDDCGNRDTIVITLTVIDTVPPVISGVPNDITVTCASDVPPIPPTSTITVMDDCALMHTVTIVDEVTNLVCANKYTLLRHFIATNECGRMDTLTQTITVNDNIKPLWMTLPQDLFVECSDPNRTTIINNWLAAFGNAMSFDNCNGPVTITMTAGLPVTTCGGSTTTVYNVTADDGCGNSITAYADLVIFDDTPPTLVPPVDITIACTDNLSTSLSSWFATTSATDGCGGTVSLTQTLISDIESCSGNMWSHEIR